MTQEFRLSVTPIRNDEYLVRTEDVAPGVPLAEEQVIWRVDDWLMEASLLMDDPLSGLLRGTLPGSNLGGLDAVGQQQAVANLVAFGQRLYGALFQGTIRDSWMMAKAIAQHQHHRLRFRLGLKGTQLHRLPWEVLYEGDRPLAAGTDIIFSRYHSSFSVTKAFQPKRLPTGPNHVLKILMVLATPSDQALLALQQEAQYLQQELQRIPTTGGSPFAAIELTTLEQPGREELTQALEHNAYHVLHYAGHSNLGQAGGSLSLVNNRTGLTESLSGEDLAGLLVNNGVRMAVLNSCRGVYTATSESNRAAEGNLAEALLRRGVPAVLAMAERIPDDVALNLSRLFYRNLRQEAHPVDLSLGRSRQGLISSYTSDQLYWALPILYLHPDFDGYLLPATSSPVSGHQDYPPASADYHPAEATVFEPAPTEWPASLLQPPAPPRDLPAASWLEDSDIDLDEVGLEEPAPTEEEQVAQLAHEVSHSPTVLEPDEPRWEQEEWPGAIANSQRPTPPLASIAEPPSNDPRVYAELENVLHDMGKLTPDIAAGSRAIQANPDSAAAYTEFGWALYQQGYLTEAISTYNQAIRLDPTYATAFNRLGLAFYQQGRVDEAIRAYSRAVQLDPTLTEASTNLRLALYTDDEPPPPTKPAKKPTPPRDRPRSKQLSRRQWLWGGVGALAIAALGVGWVYREPLSRFLAAPLEFLSPNRTNSLRRYSDAELVAQAKSNLQQQQLEPAQAAIAELLDRNNIAAAATLLSTTTATNPAAEFKFLQGRLEWQRRLAGQDNASIDTARQFWEQAAQTQKSSQLQNALGFAYYAQGKIGPAEEAWYKAIRLSPKGDSAAANSDVLTAHAGLALVARKKADQQAPNSPEQATQQAEMRRNLATVLSQDRVNFQPDRLQQNWLWLDSAIQDWQMILASNPG